MNIDNINSTNFNGGFRIKKITPKIKTDLEILQKQGCKIFSDFSKEGDTLIIAYDRLDKNIEHSLKKEKVNFKYYPNFVPSVYTSSKFAQKILEITELIPFKNKAVTRENVPLLYSTKKMLKDTGYNIDFDNASIKMKQGAIKINDPTNQCKTVVSPKLDGKYYVKSMPYSNVESIDYSIIAKVGFETFDRVKCKNTPDNILDFSHKFKASLRKYDPEFLKNNSFIRTNLELLADFASGKDMAENFFAHAVNDVPELTERLCGDELFVPTREAYSLITKANKDNQNEMFKRYVEFIKCKNRLDLD